ncbi:MAG: hypothetical protein ACYSWO_30820, partial [Planctomycetota bacterium]
VPFGGRLLVFLFGDRDYGLFPDLLDDLVHDLSGRGDPNEGPEVFVDDPDEFLCKGHECLFVQQVAQLDIHGVARDGQLLDGQGVVSDDGHGPRRRTRSNSGGSPAGIG